MLRVETNKGETKIKSKGTVVDLIADVFVIIKALYEDLDDFEKEIFRDGICKNIELPFVDSDEDEPTPEVVESGAEELLAELKASVDKLKNILESKDGDA